MRIFISYAHVDKPQVRQVVEILHDGGVETWFDHQLVGGKSWKDQLYSAIAGCDAFLYALTPESVDSEWCQWELGQAIEMGKPIIPVLMRKRTVLPDALIDIQYVDFSDGVTANSAVRLLRAVRAAEPVSASNIQSVPINPQGTPAQAVVEIPVRSSLRIWFTVTMIVLFASSIGILLANDILDGQKIDSTSDVLETEVSINSLPLSAEDYFNLGLEYGASSEYELAIGAYSQVINYNPEYISAYTNRCWAYMQTKAYEFAIVDCTKAIELDANNVSAYSYRGSVYRSIGELDLSIADYTQAIGIKPDFAGYYVGRGYSYSEKGEYDLAIDDYTTAIEFDPENISAYINRGSVYKKLQQYDLALVDYDKAIQIVPDIAGHYLERANLFGLQGKYDLAIADYTRAIEYDPNFAGAYLGKGNAYSEKGEYDLAIRAYLDAIEIDNEYDSAYANLGYLYYRTEQYADALETYQHYLDIAGDNPSAFVVERVEELEGCVPNNNCGD